MPHGFSCEYEEPKSREEIAASGEIDSLARFVASMPYKKTSDEDRSRI